MDLLHAYLYAINHLYLTDVVAGKVKKMYHNKMREWKSILPCAVDFYRCNKNLTVITSANKDGYVSTFVNICICVYTMHAILMYTMSVSNVTCKVVTEQGHN